VLLGLGLVAAAVESFGEFRDQPRLLARFGREPKREDAE
jgi:hypothetical protein